MFSSNDVEYYGLDWERSQVGPVLIDFLFGFSTNTKNRFTY